jgi:GTP pyrophosphokinase
MSTTKKPIVNGGYPLHTFHDVEAIYETYITSKQDRESIFKAYEFVLEKHDGQLRKSGEPYYHHLIEVAYIVAELQGGPMTITAALLHDVVEDTDVSIDYIEKQWGKEVATIVDSLTKIQRLKLSKFKKEEFEAEDHRKILIGMAKDIRVIIIKLADRLHNLRTLGALSPERQVTLAKESMEVFVPIAHRLGLNTVKSEMEDICLQYIEPEKFKEIKKLLSHKAKTMGKSLDNLKKRLADILFENNISFDISSRVKSIHSIYNKMYVKGHSFNEIYDILALRIITDSEIGCYQILGLIHKIYKPVPGRFKDYIAMPKPNMYQSLHTTIVSGDGNFYEIQIRTKEMDEIAETGVAAHWAYKENSGYNSKQEQREIEDKLHWFRDFVSMSNENQNLENASEFMDSLTQDIFEANVYVFTPKGKVIELPKGSTPIDFAYRIHTKIGDHTVGALVNGMMVPLNTILVTGDMVEIRTSRNSNGPSEGWLDFVRSSQAKACIRKFITKKNSELVREERIAKGKQSCLDAFADRDIDEQKMLEYLSDPKLLDYYGFETVDDLFVAVSGRKPTPGAIIDYLKIKKPIDVNRLMTKVKTKTGDSCPVYTKGASKIAITLANCCTPIPGDSIVGYVTRGKGISVHRKNCPNVARENERLIDVYWRDDLEYATYPVDIVIEANDRNNLVVDIMTTLTNNKVTLSNLNARINSNMTCTVAVTLMVSDAKRLNDIFNILTNVSGVYSVGRVIH